MRPSLPARPGRLAAGSGSFAITGNHFAKREHGPLAIRPVAGIEGMANGGLSRVRKTVAPFVTNHESLKTGRVDNRDVWPVFSGVVEELSLFSRALSAEEIARMYRTGAPD